LKPTTLSPCFFIELITANPGDRTATKRRNDEESNDSIGGGDVEWGSYGTEGIQKACPF
jgi:hypothetical protein